MYAVPFTQLGLEDVPRVGGKAAHLADLIRAGFPVPGGFAVTTAAFDAVVAGLEQPTFELVEHAPVLDAIASEIAAAYAALGGDVPVAVRSSAVAEDAAGASFAGMQSTYLWRRGEADVLAAVRSCWASYFNPEAVAYRRDHATAAAGMSVVVQRMVDSRVAGVMFTLNPVTGDRSSIAIDAGWGLGVTVVGGEVTPDSFLVSKVTRDVLRSELGTKEVECVVDVAAGGTVMRDVEPERRGRACLEPDELRALADLGRDVESHYGRPQDIEWAIDRESDELVLLQARPETVWSNRPRELETQGDRLSRIAAAYLPKR